MDTDQHLSLNITQERTEKKSITDFSIRSSQCSLLTPNSEDFYEACRSNLKISPRNAILNNRLYPIMDNICMSFSGSVQFEELAKKQLAERRKQKELETLKSMEQEEISKHDPLSLLTFFIVPENHLKFLIPDYEKFMCRETFSSLNCHESYFGLARLYAYEGKFLCALEYLKKASELKKDKFYELWITIFRVKTEKVSESEVVVSTGLFKRFFCCSTVRKKANLIEILEKLPENEETLWALFHLSFKAILDIDIPEHYAAKIKSQNEYLGYISWSEIYFRRGEEGRAIDLLKELIRAYGKRPEAYIKLWNYFYYCSKDYIRAEDIASEALMKLDSQTHAEYYILFCVYLAKVYFKQRRFKECLGFLQRKFVEHPTYPVFLYMYGRLGIKSEEFQYNGSVVSALQESLRLCDTAKHGLIYYWLAKSYMLERVYTKAYKCAKLAVTLLLPTFTKKILELRSFMKDLSPGISKIEAIKKLLRSQITSETVESVDKYCREIKKSHSLKSEVFYAELLWKTGNEEEALKKLYTVCSSTTIKMTGYYLLIDYLEQMKNVKCLKTVAYEMLKKCRNPQVPSNTWYKANLKYAKVLVKIGKPGRAVLLLESLARIMPPFPFLDVQYTKILQRAKNIQEITNAHSKLTPSLNAYVYGNYKNSFIDTFTETREFSKKLVEDEDQRDIILIPRKSIYRRDFRINTEKIDLNGIGPGKKTFCLFVEDLNPPKENELKVNMDSDITKFSVCSNPLFLYKIGKISMKYSVCLKDGVCAIQDFIKLIQYSNDKEYREKMEAKAMKVYSNLLESLKD